MQILDGLQTKREPKTVIYKQDDKRLPFSALSRVSKGRLAVMYNIYLRYLLNELRTTDPDAASQAPAWLEACQAVPAKQGVSVEPNYPASS